MALPCVLNSPFLLICLICLGTITHSFALILKCTFFQCFLVNCQLSFRKLVSLKWFFLSPSIVALADMKKGKGRICVCHNMINKSILLFSFILKENNYNGTEVSSFFFFFNPRNIIKKNIFIFCKYGNLWSLILILK